MRSLFLLNTEARKTQQSIDEAIQILKNLAVDLVIPDDKEVKNFSKTIVEHSDNVDVVIVGGGDGSISAAIPGILETNLPLGVIPLGTANNFARNLGIPLDLQNACHVIATGRTQKTDVCYVNDIPFINVVGMGLSTSVNKNVSHTIKKRFGMFGYLLTAIRYAWHFRPIRIDITDIDSGYTTRVRTFQLTICNGRFFGSGIPIADDATIYDGKMDLCSFEVADLWAGLKLALRFRFRRINFLDPLRRMRSRRFRISSHKMRHVDVDGEIKTQTPLELSVHSKAIAVLTPPTETN